MATKKTEAVATVQNAAQIMSEFHKKTMEVWKDRDKIKKMVTGASTHPISEIEFDFYFAYGMMVEANPLLREIWLVKYDKDKPAQVFLGRDFYRRKALEMKGYDGHYACAVYTKDTFEVIDGVPHHKWGIGDDRGSVKGAYCVVNVKDRKRPVFVWVNLNEYNTGKALWARMPVTMITKVAEAQALRAAFSIFGGTYDESEDWGKRDDKKVKLDTKMEIVTEELRGHDKTGFENSAGEDPEKVKEQIEESLDEAETSTGAKLAEEDAAKEAYEATEQQVIDEEFTEKQKPDGTQIAKDKIKEDNGAPPFSDKDIADAGPDTPGEKDAPPLTESEKRTRKFNIANLLRIQVGNNQDKQVQWLGENCAKLFDIYEIKSWKDVKYEWLDKLEVAISELANPNS